jgi:hypothetical protein
MRFFAKLMFIFNCCFLVAAFFHYAKMYQTNADYPQPLNFLKGSIVLLAEFGWIINMVFVLMVTLRLLMRKPIAAPKWLWLFNVLVLPLQIYYFFIDKS